MTTRNGLTLAYVFALVNAGLTVFVSFGIDISQAQEAAIVGFVNVALVLAARVLHLPVDEKNGGGP